MPRFTVTLSCTFPTIEAAREALLEVNDFYEGAKLKIEAVGKVKIKQDLPAQAEPNGYVAVPDDDGDESRFWVTPIDYWNQYGHISDDSDDDIPPVQQFDVVQEGCLQYSGNYHDPAELLKLAGYQLVKWGEKAT